MEKFQWIQQSLAFLGGGGGRSGGVEEEGEDEDQREELLETEGFCNLSPMQRLYLFAAALGVGLIFMILSLIVFTKPIKFAILFTFGNIMAVGSTVFLIGPLEQVKMMLDSKRVYATAVYGASVLLAIVSALWIHNKGLTLIAMIIEIGALIWYNLSYIPFARRIISELFIRYFDTEI